MRPGTRYMVLMLFQVGFAISAAVASESMDATVYLVPTNAALLSVSTHYMLWRTSHEKPSTPEERGMHSWRPFYYPEYHLACTDGVVRSVTVPNRRLTRPQEEMGAAISIGGSILLPDKTLLLSADDCRFGGYATNLVPLTFEEDSRKLASVNVEIKPIWKEVVLDASLKVKEVRVPARYSTNAVRPDFEMFVRGSDTQRVAVVPLHETPDLRTVRTWRYEPSEKWPLLKVTRDSVTAWNGLEWHTANFQPVSSLPNDDQGSANHTSDGIRQPADGSPKPSM